MVLSIEPLSRTHPTQFWGALLTPPPPKPAVPWDTIGGAYEALSRVAHPKNGAAPALTKAGALLLVCCRRILMTGFAAPQQARSGAGGTQAGHGRRPKRPRGWPGPSQTSCRVCVPYRVPGAGDRGSGFWGCPSRMPKPLTLTSH